MAGEWVKARVCLHSHHKVISMARYLASDRAFIDWWLQGTRMSVDETLVEIVNFHVITLCVASACLKFWSVANELTRDGILHGASLFEIDEMAGVPSFGYALEHVGWCIESHDDDANESVTDRNVTPVTRVTLPNFCEWNTPGESRKIGKSGAERAREFRDRRKSKAFASKEVKDDSQAEGSARNGRNENVTGVTVEKRREEKNKRQPVFFSSQSSPKEAREGVEIVEIPTKLDQQEFLWLWAEWVKCREEMKKPLTARAARMQLADLERWGIEKAMEAVRYSIKGNYQGIFEPGSKGVKQSKGSAAPNAAATAARLAEVQSWRDGGNA